MPKTIDLDTDQNKEYYSRVFHFTECLSFLEKTGQKIYGSKFKTVEEDHPVIFKLFTYFFRDPENAEKLNIDLGKGILLMGPVGCGKTSILNIMKYIRPPQKQHIMISTRKISYQFIKEGYAIIEKYSDSSFIYATDDWIPKTYCFDDLGVENNLKYYGNECNVMAEIVLSRYDLFISRNMLTHITTNLTSSEIENIYGIRVRSRLRQMCNLVSFGDSKDKRV
ncbi:ATP-binding cassette domain-containing protein [Reichenbachiella sp. MALMAid0571]|uniref:ATP-binding cassette domain-containing protein n=1 Tax=Reichenbachiella sp. MALMAid0571 TaxID=3143939 RepID=UPI0032DE6FFC